MAEEASLSAEVPEEKGPPDSKSHAAAIHEQVATALKRGADQVRQRVVETLVEEKLEERKKMVLDGLGRLRAMWKEIEKMKRGGDQRYTLDKKPIGEMTYTKSQGEEIEKATQKVNKLSGALDKAIGNGDYTKLQEELKKQS